MLNFGCIQDENSLSAGIRTYQKCHRYPYSLIFKQAVLTEAVEYDDYTIKDR